MVKYRANFFFVLCVIVMISGCSRDGGSELEDVYYEPDGDKLSTRLDNILTTKTQKVGYPAVKKDLLDDNFVIIPHNKCDWLQRKHQKLIMQPTVTINVFRCGEEFYVRSFATFF